MDRIRESRRRIVVVRMILRVRGCDDKSRATSTNAGNPARAIPDPVLAAAVVTSRVVRWPVRPTFCRYMTVPWFSTRKTYPVVMAAQAGYSPLLRALGDSGLCIPKQKCRQCQYDGRPERAAWMCKGGTAEGVARRRMGRSVKSMIGYCHAHGRT